MSMISHLHRGAATRLRGQVEAPGTGPRLDRRDEVKQVSGEAVARDLVHTS